MAYPGLPSARGFPFPANSDLDWDALRQTDYLYVSHLHRAHVDPKLLRRHVHKNTTMLLPDHPTDELQRRCPHLCADLTKFGSVSGGILTYALYGWRFDLAACRCLTVADHQIRATLLTS